MVMAEPENHTLRLLREFREETREFRQEAQTFQRQSVDAQLRTERAVSDLRGDVADLRGDMSELRADVAHVKDRVDSLTQAVAGEIVQARYVHAGVDDRLAEIERRLTALEQAR
jgi:hypothetical protein